MDCPIHMVQQTSMTTPNDPPITPDAVQQHWSLRVLPRWARPYGRLMRLERPVGWPLLFWPCAFASLLASLAVSGPVQWSHLILFFVGSIVMRGAGCTLNDIADRDIDAKVARTAARPIPSGEVSVKAAVVFLGLLLLVGFAILVTFNLFTIGVGIASLALIAIYPFMKRITNWPQVVLGLVFAWGALVGWSAQMEALNLPTLLLYVACVIWIIGYDTIYAFQDLEDDAMAGIGSSALALGERAPMFVAACYVVMIALISAAYTVVGVGLLAFAGLALAAVQMGWQIKTLDISDKAGCLARFKSNNLAGLLIMLGLLAEILV